MKKIPYGKQNITDEDIQEVVDTLRSDFLTQGPRIKEFENDFAEFIGCKFAIAVSNGTAALHLSAKALNTNGKTKVITTPISFVATANCIKFNDGDIVFADIDPNTYLLDINNVRKLLSKAPIGTYQGIIPVDFAGRTIEMEKFKDLANEFGCWIIEDACHSPGGYFQDSSGKIQKSGNGKFADLATFSFHPVKHIACGEGGMITTDSEELYNKLLLLRTHGITKNPNQISQGLGGWYYEMQELGFNYRLTDFQAALGKNQLKRVEEGIKLRREIALRYYLSFKNKPYILGQTGLVEGHAYHLYIIEVKNRKELYEYLHKNNILVQVHYIPIHLMPYYKKFGWKDGDFPVAENYYRNCLSLPMFPTLSIQDQEFVINHIINFYE
jgi:UDP-4-amino-4,6-dideoxy-N-acetyl-beta-L-altrosamine transaminase